MKAAIAAAVASFAIAGSANAAIVTGFIPGGDAPIGTDTLLYDFTDGNLGVLDPGYVNTKIQSTTDGDGAQNPFSIPGGNYLDVLAGGSATITFDSLMRSISFNWGSVDSYNTLTIHWSGGDEVVIGNPGGGDQSNPSNNGVFFATVGAGESITGLTFASSQNSFEIDDISGSAVPEPATWAMMIAGFGLAGTALRRRRTAFAAA
ncbi:MAG TPA: PEPxxWA-CTERM sorting domain-containing protein [Phenylobacterium sp.]|uniref:Ice-binding protein C-terminal domain-containing protein n=1 Tax=Phenylobacterium koreense TaxID=266125 RepID=A0ABV2EJM0_9CAUL